MEFQSILQFSLWFLISAPAVSYTQVQTVPYSAAQEPFRKIRHRLANPLIGDNGRVYVCSENNLFAFENSGSIAWTIPLNYTCSTNIAPVQGPSKRMYVVAENRVLLINYLKVGSSEAVIEEYFGPDGGEIVGLALSISSSCVIINVKRRGLFAYRLHGKLLWSAGPVLYQQGYRQGCRKNMTECYFSSVPTIDHCEASIYIANSKGELYSLSIRSPHFKWIQDLSNFDKQFIVTPASNGVLYVTLPVQALVLALDVSTGNILWQRSIGPLSSKKYLPTVDSNGWISIGSVDGFLYSFSPKGILNKFPKVDSLDSAIQVSPVIDCSGYAVYVSQTEMEGKVDHKIGDYTFVSALKPKSIRLTLLVPAIGSVYWSERYPPGEFLHSFSQSDLSHFELDESVLIAFIAASSIGNPLPCRTTRLKFASSCSQARDVEISTYTGNEKAIMLFLLFETTLLIILAAIVRYCFIFWKKTKLQSRGLVKFLEKRQSLHLQKKVFDRTITELQQKAAAEPVTNNALEQLNNVVKEREGIVKKLSTTYSLGRDSASLRPSMVLPLYEKKTKSFSFQGLKRENVTIFHTLSDTSTSSSSSSSDGSSEESDKNLNDDTIAKVKGKAPMKVHSSSEGKSSDNEHESWGRPSTSASSSRIEENRAFMKRLFRDEERRNDEEKKMEIVENGSRSIRRRAFSSTY